MEWMSLIAAAGFGVISSYLGGLVGLGGGFILIPLLTLVAGFEMKQAIILSLTSLIWLGLMKTHHNRNLVRAHRNIILPLGLMGGLGAGLAAFFAGQMKGSSLELIFSVLLIIIAIYLLATRHWHPEAGSHSTKASHWARAIFFLSGALAGLLGLGGGIVNVPVLHRLLRFRMEEATRLNFPFILIASAIALLVFQQSQRDLVNSVPPYHVIALMMGTSLGSHFSNQHKFTSSGLKVMFASIMLILGVLKLAKLYGYY
jgi:uncharacterized membrane protein YfcA